MKIQRAFKARIYPSDEQRVFLNKTFGSRHFLYNKMPDERIKTYEALKYDRPALSAHTYKTEKQYKQAYSFLKEADAVALQQARCNLERACASFYASLKGAGKGVRVGFPRFKAKREHKFRYWMGMSIKVDFDAKTVKLPNLGCPVRFKCMVNIKSWYGTAVLRSISVSRMLMGTYFASCLLEGEPVRRAQCAGHGCRCGNKAHGGTCRHVGDDGYRNVARIHSSRCERMGISATGRSRNLVEQAEQSALATGHWL